MQAASELGEVDLAVVVDIVDPPDVAGELGQLGAAAPRVTVRQHRLGSSQSDSSNPCNTHLQLFLAYPSLGMFGEELLVLPEYLPGVLAGGGGDPVHLFLGEAAGRVSGQGGDAPRHQAGQAHLSVTAAM